VRVLGVRGRTVELAVTDNGAGVDPQALAATVGGSHRSFTYRAGRARVDLTGLSAGRHTLVFSAADYQETKNTEDIFSVLPNTRTLRVGFVIP
jgi:hypothetical protein